MQVIAVPLERDRAAAGLWKKQFKAGFPFVFDPKMTIAKAYGVEGIPVNVAIDRNGRVLKVIEGADTEALEAVARQLAAGKSGRSATAPQSEPTAKPQTVTLRVAGMT